MKRLIAAVFITTLLASCAGSSTVTVGGRPVSMPKKAADEHEKGYQSPSLSPMSTPG